MPPHRWQPTRLPRPCDSPGKNIGSLSKDQIHDPLCWKHGVLTTGLPGKSKDSDLSHGTDQYFHYHPTFPNYLHITICIFLTTKCLSVVLCKIRVFKKNVMYLFIFGCFGSLLLCMALCSCRLQAVGHVGSVLWHIGFVAPRQVGYSQIRNWTCVYCRGKQILNHWTTTAVPRILKDILWISVTWQLVLKLYWSIFQDLRCPPSISPSKTSWLNVSLLTPMHIYLISFLKSAHFWNSF